MNSVRDQIIEWIVTNMPTQVTTANGYHNDLVNVKRGLASLAYDKVPSMTVLPAVIVSRGTESKQIEDTGMYSNTLSLEITGWIQASDDLADVDTRVDRLVQDIEEFLAWADDDSRNFGGLVEQANLISNSFEILEDDEVFVGAIVDVDLLYTHDLYDHSEVRSV